MVWVGDNYPQEYLTEEEQQGPTDDEIIPALRASNERLREAVALLNSMVLSGESHSDYSRQLVHDALASPW